MVASGAGVGRWPLATGVWQQKVVVAAANNSSNSKIGDWRRTRRGKFGFCLLYGFFDLSNLLGLFLSMIK